MITRETLTTLEELREAQNSYTPLAEIAEQIGEKALICIFGPSCVGKSTDMQTVTELDSRFAVAGTLTSREARRDDIGRQYDYVEHTDAGLRPIIEKILKGQVVQYGIHPTSKHLYLSLIHI